jgi:hypothetical protein
MTAGPCRPPGLPGDAAMSPHTAHRQAAPSYPERPAPAAETSCGMGETGGIEPTIPASVLASELALKQLVNRLAAGGLPLTGMMLTRWQAMLILRDGRVMWCCCGWLLWRTGKVSSRGRPLHTLHSVHDPAGAVRRLTQTGPSPSAGLA